MRNLILGSIIFCSCGQSTDKIAPSELSTATVLVVDENTKLYNKADSRLSVIQDILAADKKSITAKLRNP